MDEATPNDPGQLRASVPSVLTYDHDMEPGRYLQVRCDFLRSEEIDAPAKLVYLVLCAFAASGMHTLPSRPHIAQQCGLTGEQFEQTVEHLLEIGLLTVNATSPLTYHLHTVPDQMLNGKRHSPALPSAPEAKVHIPLANHNSHIHKDSKLLIERLGISEEVAVSLAQLAAKRGCSAGYVADVVEYATTTPGIKNPAGCAVELIRRNERRRPARQQPVEHPRDRHQTLDPQKYTSGKYAFLFRPHHSEGSGSKEGFDGYEADEGEINERMEEVDDSLGEGA